MSEIFSLPRESWLRYLIRLLMIVVAIYLIWQIRLALVVLLLGGLLAYVLRPLVGGFERIRIGAWSMRRPLATAMAFLIVAGLITGVVISLLPRLAAELDELKNNLPAHRERFASVWHASLDFYRHNLPSNIREAVDSSFAEATDKVEVYAAGIIPATFRGIGFVLELFLVPILALYFLVDAGELRRQVIFFVPERQQAGFERALDGLNLIMYRYVAGQLILCFIAFIVVSLALWALDINFWLLLGVVAGITRAVPVIGPLLGGIPVVAAVLVQSPSPSVGFWVTIGLVLLHLFESKYLMPAILGHKLQLHPVLIIFALLVGAHFFGLIGMFIAVPILAGIRFLIADYRAHPAITSE
jgi:predicted PurR-regulated permease PerM